MRNNWNLFIVCFLCVLCFQPYQVNAQTQSQKKITIEISNERLPSVLKRLENSPATKSYLRMTMSRNSPFPALSKIRV